MHSYVERFKEQRSAVNRKAFAINGAVKQESKNILNKVELVATLTFFIGQRPCIRSISSTQLWISRTKEFRTLQRQVILVDMRG